MTEPPRLFRVTLEVAGLDQADAVGARLTAAGFTGVALVHDLGKNPRVTRATAP